MRTNVCAIFANPRGAHFGSFRDSWAMQPPLVSALRARRPQMHAHWEALLRAEPVATPLGHPDALMHLIDWTLDEIFTALVNPLARQRAGATRFTPSHRFECPCGKNPLLAYFAAGAQAVREGLVLAQFDAAPLDPLERDAAFEELNLVLQQTAQREIESFCGICQLRSHASVAADSAVASP